MFFLVAVDLLHDCVETFPVHIANAGRRKDIVALIPETVHEVADLALLVLLDQR